MKLSKYLAANKIKPATFARQIKVHRSSVTRFCSGDRKPDLETLEKIDRATNGQVTARDFFAGRRVRIGVNNQASP